MIIKNSNRPLTMTEEDEGRAAYEVFQFLKNNEKSGVVGLGRESIINFFQRKSGEIDSRTISHAIAVLSASGRIVCRFVAATPLWFLPERKEEDKNNA